MPIEFSPPVFYEKAVNVLVALTLVSALNWSVRVCFPLAAPHRNEVQPYVSRPLYIYSRLLLL